MARDAQGRLDSASRHTLFHGNQFSAADSFCFGSFISIVSINPSLLGNGRCAFGKSLIRSTASRCKELHNASRLLPVTTMRRSWNWISSVSPAESVTSLACWKYPYGNRWISPGFSTRRQWALESVLQEVKSFVRATVVASLSDRSFVSIVRFFHFALAPSPGGLESAC